MGGMLNIPYEGLIDIPEGTRGDFSVKHIVEKPGALFQTHNARTAIYGGHGGATISYDHETRWHELLEGNGRWTSDLPIEQWQQRQLIKGFRGRVLVGGLGLGVVVRMLAKYKNVTRIDVVEQSPEVIALVGTHIKQNDRRINIIQDDLFDYLWNAGSWKRQGAYYWDHAFFDIWASDSEHTLYNTVLPLTRMAQPQVKHRVRNWNEDVMRGQVRQSLLGPFRNQTLGFTDVGPKEVATWTDHEWWGRLTPFYQALVQVNANPLDETEMRMIDVEAWRWAMGYDGSPEFGERWLKHFDEQWSFTRHYVNQLPKTWEELKARLEGDDAGESN